MILLLTRKISGTSDMLMQVFAEQGVPAFRFNFDLFDHYKFQWTRDGFRFEDPMGRVCDSRDVTEMVFYKGLFSVDEPSDVDRNHEETKFVKSWMDALYHCFVRYGMERNLIRLIHPNPTTWAKTWQMEAAEKYFPVPEFMFHFGFAPESKEVITKNLTGRIFTTGDALMASVVDRSKLDPAYPWFTQDIAPGTRDATVLYVNGNVHCFQFATERSDCTDWRITQGTDANRWEPWDAGAEFEEKVRRYMRDMGLMFGRLDFIIGGEEPQFLEVNPCGQFGWLDDEEHLTLHHEVAAAILDPSTTLRL